MELAEAVARYRETRSSAVAGLTAFVVYCEARDTRALMATDAVHFLGSLASQGYAARTILRYRTGVNGFLWWLCEGDLVPFGREALERAFLEQGEVLPRQVRGQGEGPEEGEVRALVEAAYAARPSGPPGTAQNWRSHLVYLRNIAIVETLRATGARPGELTALRRGDLDEEQQTARAPDGRTLYFDLASWAALARYFEARRDPVDCPLLLRQTPVFAQHDASKAGKALAPLVANRVGVVLRELRRSETVTARGLRVRFGRRLLAATEDEKGTARLLGIKGLDVVRRYRGE